MAATKTKPVGPKPDKLIRDALLAHARKSPRSLKRAITAIWVQAGEGNVDAFREIANRIDGRVALALQGGGPNSPPITTEDNGRMPLPELARLIASILLRGQEEKETAD